MATAPTQISPGHDALGRVVPSGRWLAIGFGAVALIVAGYAGARETSAFAVQRVEVTGARPFVVQRVESALEPLSGRSLLTVDRAAIDRRLEALPDVRLVSYDRAFPNTARIVVAAERPVAILRRGTQAWLVSEQGRVLRRLVTVPRWRLPRIWVSSAVAADEGAILADSEALAAGLALGRTLTADAGFLRLVRGARAPEGELAFTLRGGEELRLGTSEALPLKVAVARRVLATVGEGSAAYLDVSVPERPVMLANPQVEG